MKRKILTVFPLLLLVIHAASQPAAAEARAAESAGSPGATTAPTAAATVEALGYLDNLPPLIDRTIFFGDPEITGGQISPDGAYISFRKPYLDVMNIWIKGIDEPFEAARPVTADTIRPVRAYAWTEDGRYIIYVQDKGGDENWHVYAVDPAAEMSRETSVPPARDLTPYPGVRAVLYARTRKEPNILYIGLNDRDERYFDPYRLDIQTGERTLIRENDEEVADWIFDLDGNLRLAMKQTEDGGTEIFRLDEDGMTSILACSNEETIEPIRFHPNGDRFYLRTDMGEDVDLSRLALFDPATMKEELIEADPEGQVDFGGAIFSRETDELVGTYYIGDRLRTYWRDERFERDFKKLRDALGDEAGGGDIRIVSATRDETIWLVNVTRDVDPGAAYIFDRAKGKARFLYRPRPELPIEHLAPMKPIRYTARDGLEIPAYLTIPRGVKPEDLAVVVQVHGGPWARDVWEYDPYTQFLANRGYAVLQPNFRGSAGYGKRFLNAAKREWGEAVQDDITDGVNYLIKKGIADPERIGIWGGSFGGYATLCGLAFTPDLYAVGVSLVGPSSLITLLRSIPPYWETMRAYFNEQIGDPDRPNDFARLKRQSPLFSADKITKPLLVGQGANDPRVKKAESDQIVAALRDAGHDVRYIVAPDEGHGFARVENRMAFTTAMEKFLSRHLGGRFQRDIDPAIARRLEEITVDVATVEKEDLSTEMEKAKDAPLPPVDGSLVEPMRLSYDVAVRISGQEFSIDMIRVIEKATNEDIPVWRITSTQKSPTGSSIDTFDIDRSSLLPVFYVMHQGPNTTVLRYDRDGVRGHITMMGQEAPVDKKLDKPVFGEAAAIEVTVPALPLADGYETTLRVFEWFRQEARPMKLNVTDRGSVTVPAGTFEAFKCILKPLDGEEGGGVLFASERNPRCVIKATYVIPSQFGGGTVIEELAGYERVEGDQ